MQGSDKSNASFMLVTGIPFLMMAMLLFWAGAYGLRDQFGLFWSTKPPSYHTIKIVMSVIVMLFSIISLRFGWLTEGIVFLFFSTSSLSTSISSLFTSLGICELQEIAELDLVYGLLIIVCSAFMIRRRSMFRGLASLLAGVALTIPTFSPQNINLVYWALVVSGAFYFIYFAFMMYHTDDDMNSAARNMGVDKMGQVGDTHETVMIVGGIAVGLSFLFEGGTILSGLDFGSTSAVVSIMMLSIVTIAIAAYASMKGELAESVLFLMIASNFLFMTIALIGRFDVSTTAVEFVTSAVVLATMISFIRRFNWIPFIISTMVFIQGVVLAFVGLDAHTSAWYAIVLGALCVYSALSIWLIVELKREILPVFDGFGRRTHG